MANWTQHAADALSTAVNRRRAFLAMSQLDVWQAGGPSNSTMTSIEGATSLSITAATLRKLDIGLKWPLGTALGILKGDIAPVTAAEMKTEPAGSVGRGLATLIPDEPEVEPDYLESEKEVIGDAWAEAHDLVAAINALDQPSEELREVARRIIFTLSAFLIIRILTGNHAAQLEQLLGRIYTEREQLYRSVTIGEPRFPWLTVSDQENDDESRDPPQSAFDLAARTEDEPKEDEVDE